jgi:hypothetical protein
MPGVKLSFKPHRTEDIKGAAPARNVHTLTLFSRLPLSAATGKSFRFQFAAVLRTPEDRPRLPIAKTTIIYY